MLGENQVEDHASQSHCFSRFVPVNCNRKVFFDFSVFDNPIFWLLLLIRTHVLLVGTKRTFASVGDRFRQLEKLRGFWQILRFSFFTNRKKVGAAAASPSKKARTTSQVNKAKSANMRKPIVSPDTPKKARTITPSKYRVKEG